MVRTHCPMSSPSSRGKSSADISAELTPRKISSCVIVDTGKASMKSLGTTHHDLLLSTQMSCQLARTFRSHDRIPLRLRDSCRSTSRRRRRGRSRLVQSLPTPSEKFRRQLRRRAISPAVKPQLKEPRRRVRFLRREEADRLIEALPEHMKPIVEFALSTGCRAGEIPAR